MVYNQDENSEEYKERERRALLAKIKQIGVPLDEIRAVIDEQDALRGRQFANVVKQIHAAKTDHEIGLILRSFAEYIIEEARIGGIRARDDVGMIVDRISDMGEEEVTGE